MKIVDIQFAGAAAFTEKELAKQLKTKEKWFFSWLTGTDKFKDEQFEDDKERLAEFYRNKGYLDFEIKDVVLEYPQPDRLVIKFQLFEGKPYKVGVVAVKGNSLFPSAELEKDIRMSSGKTFTPAGQRKDVERLRDFTGPRGSLTPASTPCARPTPRRATWT